MSNDACGKNWENSIIILILIIVYFNWLRIYLLKILFKTILIICYKSKTSCLRYTYIPTQFSDMHKKTYVR